MEIGKLVKDRWIQFETIEPRLMMARSGYIRMGSLSQEEKEQLCVIFGETGQSENDFWIGYFLNIFPNFKIVRFSKRLDSTRELTLVETNEFESYLSSEIEKINF